MPSSTITLYDHADASVTLTLSENSGNRCVWRDATRALDTPLTLTALFTIGKPGSRGNDRVAFILADTRRNTTTNQVSTLTSRIEYSIPRDSATFTANIKGDAVEMLASLFKVDGLSWATLLTSAKNFVNAVMP